MKVPEKIYLEKVYPNNGVLPNGLNYSPSPTDIEYIRTDAFIEKASDWLRKELCDYFDAPRGDYDMFIGDFKQAMKDE